MNPQLRSRFGLWLGLELGSGLRLDLGSRLGLGLGLRLGLGLGLDTSNYHPEPLVSRG